MLGRAVLLSLVVAIGGSASLAETFLGRKLEVFDGRQDMSKPAPVVIVLHGFLATSRLMRRATAFDEVAEREGFVVVYPNGRFRGWNDGRAPTSRFDDVGYLTALIRSLIDDGTAIRGKVYIAGHSNGGGMAMRMACDRPDLVDGIAVIATKSPRKYSCENGPDVSAVFFHGTDDPISPHAGRSNESRLGGTLSSVATINLWKDRNGCSNTAKIQDINQWQDGTSVKVFRFRNCAASLIYVELEGHGHAWPRPGARSTRLQGKASQELDAAAFAYEFFKTLR
ncbi:MAG: alpha/beta fold hydrolase [Pseudomonadota bacterium]